ncbi:MAG: hypothetical protein HC843_12250 [Sphingomonadales bacterium]|nr:hypothetical protein [Sphingomonadales bacterium]
MSPQNAAHFMRIIAIISMLSAILFAAAVVADPTGLNNLFLHGVSSGSQGLAGINTAEARVTLAIAGGVFAGFSAMLLLVAVPALHNYDVKMIRAVQMSLMIWFVVDSSASIAGGNAANAVANLLFLTVYMAPLMLVKEAKG